MSVTITREDLIAYAEVDYIIKHMNERYISKLPNNILVFFDTMKDPEFEVHINPHKPLQEQGLKKYSLEIIALLHVKYWCSDQHRKKELLDKMRENEEKFEEQLRQQFSVDQLFQNPHEVVNTKVSSKDPVITAYSSYQEENPDIQDYTDVQDEIPTEELTESNRQISLFEKVKLFISKMFGKK